MIKILQKENPEYFLSKRNITPKKSLSKSLKLLLLSVTLILFSITVNAAQFSYLNSTSRPVNGRAFDFKSISSIQNDFTLISFGNQISSIDTTLILQKCINVNGLSQFYSKNVNGSFKPLVVMQHAVSFSVDVSVLYAGTSVNFKSKGDIKNENIEAYFYFNEFKIDQNTAKIEFSYHYDQETAFPKSQMVSLELTKSGDLWNVTSTKMEAR